MAGQHRNGCLLALLLVIGTAMHAGSTGSILFPGTVGTGPEPGRMGIGDELTSPNKKYKLVVSALGRIEVWRIADKVVIWRSSEKRRMGSYLLEIQENGNLCLYRMDDGKELVWESHTPGTDRKSVQLRMENDGNLCIYTVNKVRRALGGWDFKADSTWNSGADR